MLCDNASNAACVGFACLSERVELTSVNRVVAPGFEPAFPGRRSRWNVGLTPRCI